MNNLSFKKNKTILIEKLNSDPQLAIITGSGVKLFEDTKPLFSISYSKLKKQRSKEVKKQRVIGHEGKLKIYEVSRKNVLVFAGRKHLYQGFNIVEVISNVRFAYELGIKKLLITNAAGGIKKNLNVGDLMLITGFIDLMQPTERGLLSSIIQPPQNISTKLNKQIFSIEKNIKKGIYAGVKGPTYETFAEIQLLQNLGASAVGMSTIPEIICASSLGIDFAAVSVISNVWNKNHKPSHKDVLHNVKKANEKLNNLVLKLLGQLNL